MENNHLIRTQFGYMTVDFIYGLIDELAELEAKGEPGAGAAIQYFMDVLDANGY